MVMVERWPAPGAADQGDSLVDLNLDVSLIGRKPKSLGVEITRELTESDLALLSVERGIQPLSLTRISERHHALARCVASGMTGAEASAITGYTQSRISILKDDPAFQELVAFYRTDKAALVVDLQTRMTALTIDAVDQLHEKVEEGKLEPEALLDIAKFGADRTGHGPQSRNTNVNVNVNLAGRLADARRRREGAVNPTSIGAAAPTIEGAVVHSPPRSPISGAE